MRRLTGAIASLRQVTGRLCGPWLILHQIITVVLGYNLAKWALGPPRKVMPRCWQKMPGC